MPKISCHICRGELAPTRYDDGQHDLVCGGCEAKAGPSSSPEEAALVWRWAAVADRQSALAATMLHFLSNFGAQ